MQQKPGTELRTETRTIGGVKITTTQLPAMRAFVLGGRLAKLGVPSLLSFSGTKMDADAAQAIIASAASLFMQVRPEELPTLATEILACSQAEVNGTLVDLSDEKGINAAFTGNILGMVAALGFVLEVNYKDFSNAARKLWSGLVAWLAETIPDTSSSDSIPT